MLMQLIMTPIITTKADLQYGSASYNDSHYKY